MTIIRQCSIDGCERETRGRGLCATHWWRNRHGKPLDAPFRELRPKGTPCSVQGCIAPHKARGMCAPHHKRWLRGAPLDVPMRRYQVPMGDKYVSKGYVYIKVGTGKQRYQF